MRSYLLGLVLASLLPGLLGAAVLFVNQYREARAQLERQTVQMARALVQAIDNQIYQAQALGQGLASAASLSRNDLAQFHRRARETMVDTGLVESIALCDRDGQQVLNTAREFGEPLPKTAVPDMVRQVFETGRPAISGLVVGAVLQRRLVAIGVPVFVDGKVAYVMNVPMKPGLFNALLENQQLPREWNATVLDASATIVARLWSNEQFIGKKPRPDYVERFMAHDETVIEDLTLDGVPALIAFVRSRDTGWGIGIAYPLRISQVPLVRHLALLGAGFAVLLAFSLGLAWFLGGRIARAFRGIVAQAGALGADRFAAQGDFAIREAAEATRALDEAAVLLRARQAARQQAEARFRHLWDSNLVGFLIGDARGNVFEANDYLLDIIGHSREELLAGAIDWARITPPEWEEADRKALDELAASGVCTPYEKEYLRPDGERRNVLIYDTMLHDEERILALMLDVTDRKRAEKEIERLYAELEQRVEERTAELQAANRELEGFTFATSHDLRGPLGRIHSFSTLLEQRCRDRLDEEGLLFLKFIRDNASRLTFLIDDLLAHARVAQQQVELQPLDLREVAGMLLHDKAPDIEQTGAEVRVNLPDVRVLADAHLVAQAVDNLLQNALKYRDPARPLTIDIGGKLDGGRFVFSVRDNGIGFDMAYHERIFQMFQRLHGYGDIQGSGIGLALVKRAAERMGGRVWAESAPGQGAAFHLELRIADGDPVEVIAG